MKKMCLCLTVLLWCGLASSFLPMTALAKATPHAALVKNVSGDVKIMREAEILSATPGMQLFASDTILTGPDSSAGLIFIDGTLFAVGPDSESLIENYLFQPKDTQYAFSLYIKKGSALYSSGKLGKLSPESVNLKTPRATIGIRGTRLLLDVE